MALLLVLGIRSSQGEPTFAAWGWRIPFLLSAILLAVSIWIRLKFNTHPTGASLKRERLAALMGDGGIQECGYAQNCVEVCPRT